MHDRVGHGPDRILRGCFVAGLVVLFLSLSIQQIRSADFWWQLRTGQWIAQNHALPERDTFTYTVPGHEWIEVRWLFFLLTYLGWTLGGPTLLILMQTAIVGLAFLVLAWPVRRVAITAPGALVLMLAIWAASGRFIVRPEIITFLLVAVELTLLDLFRRGRTTKLVWILPLLQIVWNSSHTLFALGPVLAWLVVLGDLAGRAMGIQTDSVTKTDTAAHRDRRTRSLSPPLPRASAATASKGEPAATSPPSNKGSVRDRRHGSAARAAHEESGGSGPMAAFTHRAFSGAYASTTRLALVAAAITAATFVNVYGIRGITFPYLLFKELHASSIVGRMVEELRSPLVLSAWTWDIWAAAALTLFASGTFILRARRIDLARLFVFGAVLYLALQSVRNVALLGFVAAWAALLNLDDALEESPEEDRTRAARPTPGPSQGALRPPALHEAVPSWWRSSVVRVPASLCLVALCLIGGWYVASDRYASRWRLERAFGLGILPGSRAEEACDFLMREHASPQVFHAMTDGSYLDWAAHDRFPVFIDGRNEVFGEPFIADYLSAAGGGVDWEAFADRWHINIAMLRPEETSNLVDVVRQSPRWALVHVDSREIVFVRDIREHTDLIRRLRIDPKAPWSARTPDPVETPTGWRRLIGSVGRPWHTLGMAKNLLAVGAIDAATGYLDRAIARFPEDRESRLTLAVVDTLRNRPQDAAGLLEGIQVSGEEQSNMDVLLASLLLMDGRASQAVEPLERLVQAHPSEGALIGRLARASLEAHDYPRAVGAYRRAVEKLPRDASLWMELGHACALSNDVECALSSYETALRYRPTLYMVPYNMGILLMRRGDAAGAEARFRQALSIKQDYEPARRALAELQEMVARPR